MAFADQIEEKEEIKKIPDLKVAQWHFLMAHPEYDPRLKQTEVKPKLMEAIQTNEMAPYYKSMCKEWGVPIDDKLLNEISEKNKKRLEELEAAIKDAEENLGETEVRDCWHRKAEYLCQIGDKENSLTAFRKTFEKTVGVGRKIDLVLQQVRVGLFYMDHQLVSANLAKAKNLIEQGGDWDRKNRLKAYEGLYALAIRDFKTAADLFLDAVSTFTSYELMTYEELVFYTVIAAMLALERNDLREKVVKGADIQEQLFNQKMVADYLMALYECNYSGFFEGLAAIEPRLKFDRITAPHYAYYTRAMRVKSYKQLLSSYRSLTLKSMAETFGVSTDFIDKELHQLIASAALHCKIDRVRGVVATNQLDSKNWQYQSVIKHGDILLNRVQKMSRVINA